MRNWPASGRSSARRPRSDVNQVNQRTTPGSRSALTGTTAPFSPVNGSGFTLVVRGTTYSLAAMILARLLGTVSSIIVARLLGKENLGMLAIVNNLTSLGFFFATFGVPTALTKFTAQFAAEDRAQLPALLGTSLATMAAPVLLLGSLLFWGAPTLAQGIYHEPALTPLLQLAAFVLLVNAFGSAGLGQSLLQGLKEIKRISLINITTSAVNLPLVIGLTLLLGLRGVVTAQLAGALLGAVLVLASLSRVGLDVRRLPFNPRLLPRLLNLAFPAFVSGLVMVPVLWLTTTRLSVTRGFGEVGLFNICYGLFQLVLFLPNAVGMPLTPLIAESATTNPERMRRLLRVSLELVTFLVLILSVGTSAFARPLILALYGPGYAAASRPLVTMAGAVFFCSIGWVLGFYFAGTGKMWTGMAFNLFWFAALLGISFPLAARLGALGLGVAFWIAYLLMTLGLLIYAWRRIAMSVTYLAFCGLLSLLSLAVCLWGLDRLGTLARVLAGLGLLAATTAIAYLALPSK
ncbi:MAG: oligosaccharide flippase family protein, partial [candidate division WOR-3 bacterium]